MRAIGDTLADRTMCRRAGPECWRIAATAAVWCCAGCHEVAALDELATAAPETPPSVELAWVVQIGDGSNQRLTAMTVDRNDDVVVALTFLGTLALGDDDPPSNTGPEDLGFVKLDTNGEHRWSRSFSEPAAVGANGLAVGPSNEIAFAGGFRGKLTFGDDVLQEAGGHDALFGMIDSEGEPLWARSFGASGFDTAWGITTTDGYGSFFAAGQFSGTPTLSPGGMEVGLSSQGAVDGFVVRWDRSGKLMSKRALGGPGYQRASAIARGGIDRDGTDHLVVAGTFDGDMDFGGEVLHAGDSSDVFIGKLDSSGKQVYAGVLGSGAQSCSPYCELAIAVSPDRTPVAAGAFTNTFDFGTDAFSANIVDTFLARFDEWGRDGSFAALWAQTLDDDYAPGGVERPYGVAVGDDGTIALAGIFSRRLRLGETIAENVDDAFDRFVALFAPDGRMKWGTAMTATTTSTGNDDEQEPHAPKVAFDHDGNLIVAGWFRGEIDIAGHRLVASAGDEDADGFVAKFVVPKN